ncbi:MAG: transposase [Acidimicrobiales bacterium]
MKPAGIATSLRPSTRYADAGQPAVIDGAQDGWTPNYANFARQNGIPSLRATVGAEFAKHVAVDHDKSQYVKDGASTNMAEGHFSRLGAFDGTHHHVSREHLPRYLAEFDYRYTTRKASDHERFAILNVTDRRATGYLPSDPLDIVTSPNPTTTLYPFAYP